MQKVQSNDDKGYYNKDKRKSRLSSKRNSSNMTLQTLSPKSVRNPEQHSQQVIKYNGVFKLERSQSLPPRPPTRRKPSDMPNPNQVSARARSTGPSNKKPKGKPRGRQQQPNKSNKQSIDVDMPEKVEDEANVPSKSDGSPKQSKKDTHCGSISDHDYQQFCLRITEDIIQNDLYGVKEMHRVFKSHIEANRGRLHMEEMQKQIQQLCEVLGIPFNESHAEGFVPKPNIKTKQCICNQTENKIIDTEKKGCQCTIKRSLPLDCDQHNTKDVITDAMINPVQDALSQMLNDISDLEEAMKEESILCQQFHSLSSVTERTEPTSSSVTTKLDNLEPSELYNMNQFSKQELQLLDDATFPKPHSSPSLSLSNEHPKAKDTCNNTLGFCNRAIINSPEQPKPTCKCRIIPDKKARISNDYDHGEQLKTFSSTPTITLGTYLSDVPMETPLETSVQKSNMNVIEVTQGTHIKVRGPNNEIMEYVLVPGPIYIPKGKDVKTVVVAEENVEATNLPENQGCCRRASSKRTSQTYSGMHAAVLTTPHYTSLTTISPQEPTLIPPLLSQDLFNDLQNIDDRTNTNSNLNNALLTTDYDLTPQRDNDRSKESNLLLSDKYEIKGERNCNDTYSCVISQFYPDNATQTLSSDWLLLSENISNEVIQRADVFPDVQLSSLDEESEIVPSHDSSEIGLVDATLTEISDNLIEKAETNSESNGSGKSATSE